MGDRSRLSSVSNLRVFPLGLSSVTGEDTAPNRVLRAASGGHYHVPKLQSVVFLGL
jgi:hypothetical protein